MFKPFNRFGQFSVVLNGSNSLNDLNVFPPQEPRSIPRNDCILYPMRSGRSNFLAPDEPVSVEWLPDCQ